MKKTFLKELIIIFCFSIFFLPSVHGLAIGVSPSKFVVENALKGEQYQRAMRFSTIAEEDITITLEAYGENKDWVSFHDSEDPSKEITTLFIGKKAGVAFALVVFKIPPDTQNGVYGLQIAASKLSENKLQAKTGSAVEIKTFSLIKLEVTGDQLL